MWVKCENALRVGEPTKRFSSVNERVSGVHAGVKKEFWPQHEVGIAENTMHRLVDYPVKSLKNDANRIK